MSAIVKQEVNVHTIAKLQPPLKHLSSSLLECYAELLLFLCKDTTAPLENTNTTMF